jgi:hypothetical protein
MYLDNAREMKTIFGGSSKDREGVMSKLFSAGKRLVCMALRIFFFQENQAVSSL